jgi:putative membrane protein
MSRAVQSTALGVAVGTLALTWIHPRWPVEQAMHGSLAVLALAWLGWHGRRWPMRDIDIVLVCAFLVVHSIAARWLYSMVPYDAWAQAAFGWSPQAAFGWERNHFDRFVHLLFGLCFTTPVQVFLRQRWPGLTSGAAFALAVGAIMCGSLVYEWAEWAVALLLSPDAAEAYNGQQGDVWDAHIDMLLATIGALLSWPWRAREPRR